MTKRNRHTTALPSPSPEGNPPHGLDQAVQDQSPRDRLVEQHLPLVRRLCGRYGQSGDKDLFQIGSVGLVKAADIFERATGFAFAACAVPVIPGESRKYDRDLDWQRWAIFAGGLTVTAQLIVPTYSA